MTLGEFRTAVADLLDEIPEISAVYEFPPEAVQDLPAAILLETSGTDSVVAYGATWGRETTLRAMVLVKPRRNLSADARETFPLLETLLCKFEANPILNDTGELKSTDWTEGVLTFAGIDYFGVELKFHAVIDHHTPLACA